MNRAAVMQYFDSDANKAINRMWINVRCFDIHDVPMGVWLFVLVCVLSALGIVYSKSKRTI